MSPFAVVLVLAAAAGHAGWNLLVKQAADDRGTITWLALIAAAVLLGPALVRDLAAVVGVWRYVVASAGVEAVYVLLLTAAYSTGDLSLVYPVARGAAPLFLACWAALFLGQIPRVGGVAGIALLGFGVALVARTAGNAAPDAPPSATPVSPPRALTAHHPAGSPPWRDILLTLGVALCISVYSVIDGAAMRHAPAAGYEGAVCGLGAVLIAPLIIARDGWAHTYGVWQRNWLRVIVVGAGMGAAYVAVLVAFGLAPIAYVGALREVSIVIAAVAGWRLLGEQATVGRLVGAAVIVLGMVCIVLFG